ncbi:SDR family NAD(P)-dependent oxidoreductase [Saccharopolyspora cebuensis]|uniref:SDR family NAD(P)-dependent oxidoreductase n=1 Tax=Saccharopolyspora cebuensis TaxID=418759 RepID=UPI0031ECA9EC
MSGRTVLITGGSSSLIGSETALAFAREGAKVAITYHRNEEAAEEVANRIVERGGAARIVPFDLGAPDAASELVRSVVDWSGGLDVLVNNAIHWPDSGPGPLATPFDQTVGWEAEFDANLAGTMRVIQAALPHLRAAGAGRVVTVSSVVTERCLPHSSVYVAAKTGLHGLTKSLAWDVGPDGVLVNVVMPGWVNPRFIPDELALLIDEHVRATPTKRLPTAVEVGDTIVFLCSSANGSITGEIVRVTGGY